MATASINVRMIAQGSSERQISICVDAADCAKALRAAHAALALSNTQISIVVLGATGAVGPCTHTPLSLLSLCMYRCPTCWAYALRHLSLSMYV